MIVAYKERKEVVGTRIAIIVMVLSLLYLTWNMGVMEGGLRYRDKYVDSSGFNIYSMAWDICRQELRLLDNK